MDSFRRDRKSAELLQAPATLPIVLFLASRRVLNTCGLSPVGYQLIPFAVALPDFFGDELDYEPIDFFVVAHTIGCNPVEALQTANFFPVAVTTKSKASVNPVFTATIVSVDGSRISTVSWLQVGM